MPVKKSETSPEPPQQTPKEELKDWRRNEFLGMGFTLRESNILSETRDTTTGRHTDIHRVAKSLDQGCSKDLAFKIFS